MKITDCISLAVYYIPWRGYLGRVWPHGGSGGSSSGRVHY